MMEPISTALAAFAAVQKTVQVIKAAQKTVNDVSSLGPLLGQYFGAKQETVKALEEGTGRNEGRLGALVCEGEDDGRNILVNVGSGFSDADRSTFWTDRGDVVGQIVEVRADAITQNQDGTYSLRFPRFLRFRGFDVGEKL